MCQYFGPLYTSAYRKNEQICFSFFRTFCAVIWRNIDEYKKETHYSSCMNWPRHSYYSSKDKIMVFHSRNALERCAYLLSSIYNCANKRAISLQNCPFIPAFSRAHNPPHGQGWPLAGLTRCWVGVGMPREFFSMSWLGHRSEMAAPLLTLSRDCRPSKFKQLNSFVGGSSACLTWQHCWRSCGRLRCYDVHYDEANVHICLRSYSRPMYGGSVGYGLDWVGSSARKFTWHWAGLVWWK